MWFDDTGNYVHETYLYPFDLDRIRQDLINLPTHQNLLVRLRVPRKNIIDKRHHADLAELQIFSQDMVRFRGISIQEISDEAMYEADEWHEAVVAEIAALQYIFGTKAQGVFIKDVPDLSLPAHRTIIINETDPDKIADAVIQAATTNASRVQTPDTLYILGEETVIQLGKVRVHTLPDNDIVGPVNPPPVIDKWRAKATANINFRSMPTSANNTPLGVVLIDTEFWVLDKIPNNGYLNVRLDDGNTGWLYEISSGRRLIEYV